MTPAASPAEKPSRPPRRWARWHAVTRNWELYLLILPVVLYFLLFHYKPMFGVQLAFKNFVAIRGIWGSPWVGFTHFQRFFQSYYFARLMRNTLGISLYSLAVGFPMPILLALFLNELKNLRYKKLVQMVTYAPHFLSVVVVVGILDLLLSPRGGPVNNMIAALGGEKIHFMADPVWFKTIYVLSGVWQGMGWGSVIYIAAIASIDPQLFEAATIDGASRMQRIAHITLPSIFPTAVLLLILNTGSLMNVGFDKVFLMQNAQNMDASDVIATYVYRSGLLQADYSFSTAVGLFNAVVNFVLLASVNAVA